MGESSEVSGIASSRPALSLLVVSCSSQSSQPAFRLARISLSLMQTLTRDGLTSTLLGAPSLDLPNVEVSPLPAQEVPGCASLWFWASWLWRFHATLPLQSPLSFGVVQQWCCSAMFRLAVPPVFFFLKTITYPPVLSHPTHASGNQVLSSTPRYPSNSFSNLPTCGRDCNPVCTALNVTLHLEQFTLSSWILSMVHPGVEQVCKKGL
jgi:hypothetical protein